MNDYHVFVQNIPESNLIFLFLIGYKIICICISNTDAVKKYTYTIKYSIPFSWRCSQS